MISTIKEDLKMNRLIISQEGWAGSQSLLTYLSHQNASLLHISSIVAVLGYPRATVERYLILLERLLLIRRLSDRGRLRDESPWISHNVSDFHPQFLG